MVIEVTCPFPGCDHVSRNDDAAIVVELLKIHGLTHSIHAAATPGGKMEKLKRPTVSLAGTPETWAYFETRWGEYRDGRRRFHGWRHRGKRVSGDKGTRSAQ